VRSEGEHQIGMEGVDGWAEVENASVERERRALDGFKGGEQCFGGRRVRREVMILKICEFN